MRRWILLFVTVLMVLVPLSASANQPLTKVSIGIPPFLDYAPWIIGVQKGWFEEVGIDARILKFSMENEIVEALASGDIQIGAGSPDSALFLYPQFPELRVIDLGAVFTGFAIMGRPDANPTYQDYLDKGMTSDDAAAEVAKYLKGKTIITTSGSVFQLVLASAATAGGYTINDFDIIDMEPVEGAAAFMSGVGDAYSDGLPSRWRLEQEGYPVLLPAEGLGPGGICLSGTFSVRSFVEKNPDVVLNVMQVFYRILDYMNENPSDALEIMLDWLNREAGAGIAREDGEKMLGSYVVFPSSIDQTMEWYYAPQSIYYYKEHYEFVLDFLYRTGQLPLDSVDFDEMFICEDISNWVQQNQTE